MRGAHHSAVSRQAREPLTATPQRMKVVRHCSPIFPNRAIIVSRDAINQYSPVIVVVPLTDRANVQRSYPSNVVIPRGEGGLTVDSVASGGQVRAIAKTRLGPLRGALSPLMMQAVDRALRVTLDLG